MISPEVLQYVGKATLWTAMLSVVAMIGGSCIGFAIALMRVSPRAPLVLIATVYVQVIQGIPLLVLLLIAYFGFSVIGLQATPLLTVAVAFSIYAGAYLGEIWRGCIQSVPRQQWEASESLGFNRQQQLFKVILPQAVRIALPQTVGFVVQLIKNTSLASAVGFIELARAAQILNNATLRPFSVYFMVAVVYFLLCYPLSKLSKHFEEALNVANR